MLRLDEFQEVRMSMEDGELWSGLEAGHSVGLAWLFQLVQPEAQRALLSQETRILTLTLSSVS